MTSLLEDIDARIAIQKRFESDVTAPALTAKAELEQIRQKVIDLRNAVINMNDDDWIETADVLEIIGKPKQP